MVRPLTGILKKLQIMVAQGIAILLIALIPAMLLNAARPRALPLLESPLWKQETDHSQATISIEEVEHLYLYKKASFIDARSPELYAASHILGAWNIPEGSGKNLINEALAKIPKDRVVIVYCDDETSALSRSLSRELGDADKTRKIRVLLRGWGQWVANELPIEAGASPEPYGKAG
jgi:rhodanese-related sulfurtransferase